MPLTLPRCAECGASIRDRRDDACGFCGSALPWEAWDELLRARIEVIPCSAETIDRVLARIEADPAFLRASLEARRRRGRMRIRLDRGRRDKAEQPEAHPVQLAPLALFLFVSLASLAVDVMAVAAVVLGLLALVTVAYFAVRYVRLRSKRVRRRRRRRVVFKVGAFAILGTAPTERHSTHSGAAWRAVTLRTSRGDELRCFAEVTLGIRPGACGIGWIQGIELARFEARAHLPASALPLGRA